MFRPFVRVFESYPNIVSGLCNNICDMEHVFRLGVTSLWCPLITPICKKEGTLEMKHTLFRIKKCNSWCSPQQMTRLHGRCLRHTPPPASWDHPGQCRDYTGSSLQSENVLTSLFTKDSSHCVHTCHSGVYQSREYEWDAGGAEWSEAKCVLSL